MLLEREEIAKQVDIVLPNLQKDPEDWKLYDLVNAMWQRICFLECCIKAGETPKDI